MSKISENTLKIMAVDNSAGGWTNGTVQALAEYALSLRAQVAELERRLADSDEPRLSKLISAVIEARHLIDNGGWRDADPILSKAVVDALFPGSYPVKED